MRMGQGEKFDRGDQREQLQLYSIAEEKIVKGLEWICSY